MDHVQAFLLCPSPLFTLDGFYRYHQEKKTYLNTCPNVIVAFTKGNRFCLTHKGRTDTKSAMHFLYEAQSLRYGIN